MIRKILSILLASLCSCILLCSCNNGDDSEGPTWSEGTTETPATPPEEEQGDETDNSENSDQLNDGGIWTDRYK